MRRLFRAGFTLLTPARGVALAALARSVTARGVPGAIADCGVWRGGSTAILTRYAPGRPVWAFDSFEGLPRPVDKDGPLAQAWEGKLACSPDDVLHAVHLVGADARRVRVVPGWFDRTLFETDTGPIAILHVDADWYDSVSLVLHCLYERVSVGGFVVIDDYGEWQGAHRATDEFLATLDSRSILHAIDFTGRFWQKEV